MINLDFNMRDQFCDKCGTRCYIEMTFDNFVDGQETYRLVKTCPHAGFINWKGHASKNYIDYGIVRS